MKEISKINSIITVADRDLMLPSRAGRAGGSDRPHTTSQWTARLRQLNPVIMVHFRGRHDSLCESRD